MTVALDLFTSPDIRTTGLDAVETAKSSTPDQEMEEIRAELYAALQNIEDLPARYPDS
ncbi:hypothetical protein [Streptomyces sp. LN500]|uniref:hypothetical protein n=1 Tax=Streptomyces sp. LN500 TaxID=3112978 RepID=UPI003711105B